MGKTIGKLKKLTRCTIVFLAVALVFLAVGLGTLGTAGTTGSAYELKTERGGNVASVVLDLDLGSQSETVWEDGKETTKEYTLRVTDVYVNLGVIYAEPGTAASLRLEYGSSDTSFTSTTRRIDASFENFYTEEGAESTPDVTGALFRWVKPYQSAMETWTKSTSYHYVKLTALTHDLLVNEIVFVGEKYDAGSSTPTGKYAVIPVTVKSATPNSNESPEEAAVRAGALIDAQSLPSEVQSTYYAYADDELYTLSTLAELERGGEFDSSVGAGGYHIEGVYGSLGVDIIALSTKIFGISPFGVRFFPMLAAFGVLVLGYLLVKQISKSEKAALVFAVLYALCNLSFAFGHLGNPLMIGVFFFVASLYFCHRFYAHGMKKASLLSAMPVILSGLFGAAAITVNGAYLIPMLGVVALFAAGMVRQRKARRYKLDAVLGEGESELSEEEKKQEAGKIVEEYRVKDVAACVGFALALVFGSVLFALVFALPLYSPYVLLYTTDTSANIFTLAAHAFAGGFVGVNAGAAHSAWDVFYVMFRGAGDVYAVTAAAVNAVAAAAGLAGLGYAVYCLVRLLMQKERGKEERARLRKFSVPLAGLVLSLIMTAFGGGACGFLLLAYVFAFVLAGIGVSELTAGEGKLAKTATVVTWVCLGLLIVMFALYAVFTFSVPLSAGLVTTLLG